MMMRARTLALSSLVIVALASGCGDDDDAGGTADAMIAGWDAPNIDATTPDATLADAAGAIDSSVVDAIIADAGPPDAVPPDSRPIDAMFSDAAGSPSAGVDILFVIDNSGSMADEQSALAAAFAGFVTQIETAYGSRPSMQIGVVSTDLGAGPYNISGCTGNGDNGALQSSPTSSCTPPSGAFIQDLDLGGGNRMTNYSGTIGDAFGCIAQLGIDGCGFEQPLEAMRRALNGSVSGNAGFLRDGAALAVIILSDEDDCSTANTSMFDTSQNDITDPLGPLASFRCFEFGVECNPDNPRIVGTKSNCVPRDSSQYMYKVNSYVQFLNTLKPANWLVVSRIGGPTTPVVVGTNGNGNPQLQPSCTSTNGAAVPPIRLSSFVGSFGNTHEGNICGGISAALGQIATQIATALP
jgi:hypothetical protein